MILLHESQGQYFLAIAVGILFAVLGLFILFTRDAYILGSTVLLGSLGGIAFGCRHVFGMKEACQIEGGSIKIYGGSLSGLKKGTTLALGRSERIYVRDFFSATSAGMSVVKAVIFEGEGIRQTSGRWYGGLSKEDRTFVQSADKVVWMPPPIKGSLDELVLRLNACVKVDGLKIGLPT